MQPTKQQISAELKRMLVDDLFVEIPLEKIQDSDSLTTDIGLDSVGQVEFVSLIEERYGVSIDTDKAPAELRTLASITDFVWNRLSAVRRPGVTDATQSKAE